MSQERTGSRGPRRGATYSRTHETRCEWCGAPVLGTRKRRFCPRPKLCANKAFKARVRQKVTG